MANLVIIGAGPGGYAAALRGAALGLKVTLLEADKVGGTCLNWGCIPTKTYYHTAKITREVKQSKEIIGQVQVDFPQLVNKQAGVVKQLVGGLESLLKSAGVEVINQRGTLAEGGVKVGEELIPADNIIIATGATPFTILGIVPDGKRVFTAKEIWQLESLPESVVILGGGVIGVEFATIFSALGSKVTIVEKEKSILPQFAPSATRLVTKKLKEQGVIIKTGAAVTGYKDGVLQLPDESLEGDILLVALGNKPNTKGLGLEEVGVRLNQRQEIEVNNYLETSQKGIYAIGDVNNLPYKLAHAASKQGVLVVEKIAGAAYEPFNSNLVPRTVFTYPELAEIGTLEGNKSRFPYSANGRALAGGEADGYVEAYGDGEKIVGALIVGADACELSNLASLAISSGMTEENLSASIMTHPTLGEAFHEASLGLFGAAIHMVNKHR